MAPKKSGYSSSGNDDKDNQNDHRPGSSNDPIFTPSTEELSEEQLGALSVAFSGLTLEEQRIVAMKYEGAFNNVQAQKKQLKTVKQIELKMTQQNIKENKPVKEKGQSERYKKTSITLNIVQGDKRDNIVINKSDRLGTLRQYICRKFNLKKSQKVIFDTLNGMPFPLTKDDNPPSATTFLYSLDIQGGDVIEVSFPDDAVIEEGEEDNLNDEAESEPEDTDDEDV